MKKHKEELHEKIERIMAVPGKSGLLLKLALLGGFNRSQMLTAYNEQECNLGLCCGCFKLHVVELRNGLNIIIIPKQGPPHHHVRIRLVPTRLWNSFRNLTWCDPHDLDVAEEQVNGGRRIRLDELAQLHSLIISDSAGSVLAKPVSNADACGIILNDIKSVIMHYCKAWEKFGIVLSFD